MVQKKALLTLALSSVFLSTFLFSMEKNAINPPKRRLVQIQYLSNSEKQNNGENKAKPYKSILVNGVKIAQEEAQLMYIFNDQITLVPNEHNRAQTMFTEKIITIDKDQDIISINPVRPKQNPKHQVLFPFDFERPTIRKDSEAKLSWIPVSVTNNIEKKDVQYLFNGEYIVKGASKRVLAPEGLIYIEEIMYHVISPNQSLPEQTKDLLAYYQDRLPSLNKRKSPCLNSTEIKRFEVQKKPHSFPQFLNPKNKEGKKIFDNSHFDTLPNEILSQIARIAYRHAHSVTFANKFRKNGQLGPEIVQTKYQWPLEKSKVGPEKKVNTITS